MTLRDPPVSPRPIGLTHSQEVAFNKIERLQLEIETHMHALPEDQGEEARGEGGMKGGDGKKPSARSK